MTLDVYLALERSITSEDTRPKNVEDLKSWWSQYRSIIAELPIHEKTKIAEYKDKLKAELTGAGGL